MYSNKKPGRQGEWIINIYSKDDEDNHIPLGNGLYWLTSDGSGGWERLKAKLEIFGYHLTGHRAPKSLKSIQEDLADQVTLLQSKGYTTVLPTKSISYSGLIKTLTDSGAFLRQDNTNASAVASGDNQTVPSVTPSTDVSTADKEVLPCPAVPVELPSVTPSIEPSKICSDTVGHETEHVDEYDMEVTDSINNLRASIGLCPVALEDQIVEDDVTPPVIPIGRSEFDILKQRADSLEAQLFEMTAKCTQLETTNLKLEEQASSNITDHQGALLNSLRGSLDAGFTKMATALEFRVQRELSHFNDQINKNINEKIPSNLESQLNDISIVLQSLKNKNNVPDAPSMLHPNREDLSGIKTSLHSMHNSLNNIERSQKQLFSGASADVSALVTKVASIEAGLSSVSHTQSLIRSKLSALTAVNTEVLKITQDTINNGFGTLTPVKPPSSTPKKDDSCTYCRKLGHLFTVCPSRPSGFRCLRCFMTSHPEKWCPTLDTVCDSCNTRGHSPSLHEVTNPEDRLRIAGKFGDRLFPEFFSSGSTAKKHKASF